MNILYLHQHFALREGTKDVRSYEFSRLLHQRGHQITLICGYHNRSGLPPKTGEWVARYQLPELQVLQLNVPYRQEMSYARRILSFLWFTLMASVVAVRQRGMDVIYATSTPLTIAIPAIIARWLRRKPFVFEVRDLWPEVPIAVGIVRNPVFIFGARLLEKIAYQSAAHIVALSPGMKDGIVRTGIAPDKITVIPNSCDNELFEVPSDAGAAFRASHPFLGDRPIILYAGAFGFINNLSYLLRIAKHFQDRGSEAAFVLIGTGSEVGKIKAEAHSLGILDQNLWILDQISHAQIPAAFSAATISTSIFLAHPAMWANSAQKFFDSLAAGRPIAINYGGWQAETLRTSGAGLVIDADDTHKAADQLLQVVGDQVWISQACAAAKKLALEQFARDKLSQILEDTLEAVIHARRQ